MTLTKSENMSLGLMVLMIVLVFTLAMAALPQHYDNPSRLCWSVVGPLPFHTWCVSAWIQK